MSEHIEQTEFVKYIHTDEIVVENNPKMEKILYEICLACPIENTIIVYVAVN